MSYHRADLVPLWNRVVLPGLLDVFTVQYLDF